VRNSYVKFFFCINILPQVVALVGAWIVSLFEGFNHVISHAKGNLIPPKHISLGHYFYSLEFRHHNVAFKLILFSTNNLFSSLSPLCGVNVS
jgi:hypothetical protein